MTQMQRSPVGRGQVEVTRIGLGTSAVAGLFRAVREDTAIATIRAAHERGIRFFDTAPLYGHGLAEERLGRALAGIDPQTVTLSTKVGRLLRSDIPGDPLVGFDGQPLFPGAGPVNPVFDFSRGGVLASLEESLGRLGLERVDIVFIHDPDRHYAQAISEAVPALVELRQAGTVGAIGVGMNQAELLTRFVAEADLDCVLMAGRYTLLDQTAADLLDVCASRGVTVIAGAVLNTGVLARPRPDAPFDLRRPAAVVERVRWLEEVCGRHGAPLMAAAFQFPLAHPAISSVLVAPRSPAELDDCLELVARPLPAQLWDDLRAAGLIIERAPFPRGA